MPVENNEKLEGTLSLMSLFRSGAVLQRDKPLRVWGWYRGTKPVTVRLAGQEKQAVVADGRWEAVFDPLPANKTPQTLTVTAGEEKVVSTDLLVGDVWFFNGQSNIVFKVREIDWKGFHDIANVDGVRYFDVPHVWNREPADEFDPLPCWEHATEDRVGRFSAFGYAMACRLRQALDIPIGVVKSAEGGALIEHWLPDSSLAAAGGFDRNPPPVWGVKPDVGNGMYNTMVYPARGLTIKGIVWYQGEANVNVSSDYPALFKEYASLYRKLFDDPDLDIVTVQLPRFSSELVPTWPAFRLTQWRIAESMEHVHIVCGIDCGEAANIHPTDKRTYGIRAAELVLNKVYGLPTPGESAYPSVVTQDGQTVTVRFNNAATGLMLTDGDTVRELYGITADGAVIAPTAVAVCGDTLVATMAQTVVRMDYAMLPAPAVNLYTQNGLPVAPFSFPVE